MWDRTESYKLDSNIFMISARYLHNGSVWWQNKHSFICRQSQYPLITNSRIYLFVIKVSQYRYENIDQIEDDEDLYDNAQNIGLMSIRNELSFCQ